jgi:hypothetical protein
MGIWKTKRPGVSNGRSQNTLFTIADILHISQYIAAI